MRAFLTTFPFDFAGERKPCDLALLLAGRYQAGHFEPSLHFLEGGNGEAVSLLSNKAF